MCLSQTAATAMDEISNNTSTYLPYEIIENILFRLAVKSLLRFKSVCRQWNATISDPKFAQTHLQMSKNSSPLSFSCIVADQQSETPTAQLVAFENDAFLRLSTVDYHPLQPSYSRLLCHCDGLYVFSYSVGKCYEYYLWNPSRRSYKDLNHYRFDPIRFTYAMIHRSMIIIKVVIGDAKHYAVFYCRRNHWSDLGEMNPNLEIPSYNHGGVGAPLEGSIYWVCLSIDRENEYQIVCFDGRDEKWKILPKVDIDADRSRNPELILRERVCICSTSMCRVISNMSSFL